ncbi:hypothetical protein [Terrabacter sp. BE26]|uniref:hypothetical protein n=1 Tax=Terrabacter sp. BE26 TaxID=2898152 RepID=UPI0035BE1912
MANAVEAEKVAKRDDVDRVDREAGAGDGLKGQLRPDRGEPMVDQWFVVEVDNPSPYEDSLEEVQHIGASRGSEAPSIPHGALITSRADGSSYLMAPGGLQQIMSPGQITGNPYLNLHSAPRFELTPELIDDLSSPAPTRDGTAAPLATGEFRAVSFDSGDVFLGAGHWMRTWGTLAQSGQVAAMTRTRTLTWFGGYHGGVHLIAVDGDEAPVWMSQLHRFGVDGTWIGQSDRTDAWWEDMPLDQLVRVQKFYIFQAWAPDDFSSAVQRWAQEGKPIGDLLGTVADIAKVIVAIIALF